MRRYAGDFIAILTLCTLVGAFFFHIFYPKLQLLVTPDFGRSDAWHFSFATKFALGQSLQDGKLPLWRNDIGDGFPLFAEGQTGTLFLPNLILFRFTSPIVAYNIILSLTILTLALGTYWWSRLLGISILGSLFASITFAFSGLPITQLPHITLLQGISLLPVLCALTMLLLKKPNFPLAGIWILISSQQILAGFPQSVLLTQIICASMIIWFALQTKKWNIFGIYTILFIFSVLASTIQILPSQEFLRYSTFPNGFDLDLASRFSMPLKHLLSFIQPFALGNPKFGTYPDFWRMDDSMFWENTAYLGLIPLLLALLTWNYRKKYHFIWFLWILLLIAILLAWGKYSPLYFVYSIWPLKLFRVPSRFLWLAAISISILSGYGITYIQKLKLRFGLLLIILLFIINTVQLFTAWYSYQLYENAEDRLAPPQSLQTQKTSMITIGEEIAHNKTFTQTGWSNAKPFTFFKNGLAPDSNMYWGVRQHDVYAGRFLLRPTITNSLMYRAIDTTEQEATISATAAKFLRLFAIDTIISYVPIQHKQFTPIKTIVEEPFNITIYKNNDTLSRIRVVSEATIASTLSQAQTILADPAFDPNNNVLLEAHEVNTIAEYDLGKSKNARASIAQETHGSLTITLENIDHPSILVIADTYYPGWIAMVDDKEAPIFAANLSQRAIFIPAGTKNVSMRFQPATFEMGAWITIACYSIIIALIAFPSFGFLARIFRKVQLPQSHP